MTLKSLMICGCAVAMAGLGQSAELGFQGMVPVMLGMESDEQVAENLRRIKREYQLNRFLLCAPGTQVRLGEIRDIATYRELGKRMKRIKESLRGDNIDVGLWCTPTFKAGHSHTAMPITSLEGRVSGISYCPLDQAWRRQVIDNMTAMIAEFHPFMVLLEDDFELSNHPSVQFGCFCDLHLKRFAELAGRTYTREELRVEFQRGNVELRRLWGRLSRNTLVEFATEFRKAVDRVSPESRMGLCQAGCSRFDGDFSEAVARALAGAGQRPFIRVHGSEYSSDETVAFIDTLSSFKHYAAAYSPDVEVFHETDTYPHNGFFVSARKMGSLLTAAIAYGAKGSLYYALQYLDHPAEDTRYLKNWRENTRKWKVMSELVHREARPMTAYRTTYRSDSSCGVHYAGGLPVSLPNPWLNLLGRFGVDVSYLTEKNLDDSSVIFADVQDLRMMDRPELLALLGHRLVLDGAAARYLCDQGLGSYLGVKAMIDRSGSTFLHERIREPYMKPGIDGQMMYNFVFAAAGSEGGGYVRLSELAPSAVVITNFEADGKVAQPGMVFFQNELGGRVLTMAYDIHANHSSSIFNYRKRELLVRLFEDMAGERTVWRPLAPNVFTILNRGREEGVFYATMISLGSDPVEPLTVATAQSPSSIRELLPDGTWRKVEFSREEATLRLKLTLERLEPVFLEIKR